MTGITEKAMEEFKKVLAAEGNGGLGIKIKAQMSQSGCCSCGPSMSYEMGLVEEGEPGDLMTEMDGVRFYLDGASEDLMKDCEIDFMDEMGFMVKDKNAQSCGCGDDHDHGGSCHS